MNKSKFRQAYATGVTLFSGIYFIAITFFKIPKENMNNANIILGFLLGTAVAAIISFYYGDSESNEQQATNNK